jgi:Flp pilus assembly protein TadD
VSEPVALGESQLRAGRLEEAHALAKRALGHAHTYQERGRGTLYATADQWEQARTALSPTIDLYDAMEMPFWRRQTEAALAQVEGR